MSDLLSVAECRDRALKLRFNLADSPLRAAECMQFLRD